MNSMGIFINQAAKATGLSVEQCDVTIQSMVKAVNNGALGSGTSQMAQLAKLKKQKFTTTNNISDIVTEDTGYDREDVKKVVGWMIDRMIQTMNQGGMPALMKMVNLMKKGQQSVKEEVDYSKEVAEINEMVDKSGKKF